LSSGITLSASPAQSKPHVVSTIANLTNSGTTSSISSSNQTVKSLFANATAAGNNNSQIISIASSQLNPNQNFQTHIQQAVPIFPHQTGNPALSQVLRQFSRVNTTPSAGSISATQVTSSTNEEITIAQNLPTLTLSSENLPAVNANSESTNENSSTGTPLN
jgi:hypothetical protein